MGKMNFGQALEALKQGKKIRRRHWAGYWRKENGTVIMHCKDGVATPLLETKDLFYTLDNIAADDWEVFEGDVPENPIIRTFAFGEAIRRMKQGEKVARKGWNGKGMFVVYQRGYPDGIPCNKQTAEAWGLHEGDAFVCNPYLQIRQVNGSHSMWVPSVGDVLAEDWEVAE